jgi:hypothetical protein
MFDDFDLEIQSDEYGLVDEWQSHFPFTEEFVGSIPTKITTDGGHPKK